MLPFLKIPPENYRLFMAVIAVPLVYAMWMLMAGTAKLLSLLVGGHASYEQYLVITAFAFFPFWILAGIIDTIFSGVIDGYVLRALTGQFGPFATAFWMSFPIYCYTILYTLGRPSSIRVGQCWKVSRCLQTYRQLLGMREQR